MSSRIRYALAGALVAIAVAASVTEAQTLSINVYSQRDSRWSGDKMGATGLKVGDYGCMMTCLAAAYRETPGKLNAWLSKNGGYTSGGLLVHQVAANYDGAGGLQFVNSSGKLPGDASSVGRGIQRGAVYVVSSSRFGAGTHWVLVFKATAGQAYYLDPWDGTVRRVGAIESNNRVWVSYGASARIYSF